MSQVGISLMQRNGSSGPPPRRKKSRLAVSVALSIVVVLVAVAGFIGYSLFLKPAPDYPGPGTGSVTVQIGKGDGIPAIGQMLQREDVVLSSEAFVKAASGDDRARSIQPGSYEMRQQMSAKEALDVLTNPANRAGVVSIPEGARSSRVAEIAAAATKIPLADFVAVMKDPKDLGLPAYSHNHVEGFLFPSTYDFPTSGVSATTVLRAMVTKYKEVTAGMNLEARAAAIGQSPYSILTIASIIEGEGLVADYPKISRVIYNRLACTLPACKSEYIQGRLQMDSTLNYAQGTHDTNLSAAQLGADGPYNTHKNKGLPPTPIGNPGVKAIDAALDPAPGNWLYFVSDPKFTQFSDTFAQQQEAEKKWRAIQ